MDRSDSLTAHSSSSIRNLRSNLDLSGNPIPPVLISTLERQRSGFPPAQSIHFPSNPQSHPTHPVISLLNSSHNMDRGNEDFELQGHRQEMHQERENVNDCGDNEHHNGNNYQHQRNNDMREEEERQERLQYEKSRLHQLKEKIEKVRLTFSITNQPTAGRIEYELDKLKGFISVLSEIESKILNDSYPNETPNHQKLLDTVESVLASTTGEARDLIRRLTATNQTKVKLPPVELQRFEGNLFEWGRFWQGFDKVHRGESISPIDKLQILKGLLGKEPLEVISGLPIEADSYQFARNSLEKRYQNMRDIVDALLKKFLDIPKIQHQSQEALFLMVSTTTNVLQSLDVLKVPTSQWSPIVIYILEHKLDEKSHQDWELSLRGTELPSLESFTEFLSNKARALQSTSYRQQSQGSQNNNNNNNNSNNNKNSSSVEKAKFDADFKRNHPCQLCDTVGHLNFQCPSLISLSPPARRKLVRDKKLCENCLVKSRPEPHSAQQCMNPRRCRTCGECHHTLLHINETKSKEPPTQVLTIQLNSETKRTNPASQLQISENSTSSTILPTALVKVDDPCGNLHEIRALVDQCSKVNLISERVIQRLGLQRRHSHLPILGVAETDCGHSKGITTITIQSITNPSFTQTIECHIIPKISGDHPHVMQDTSKWPHLKNLPLADPLFSKPASVDLLLGGSLFMDILIPGKIQGPRGTPGALPTELGWVVAGSTDSSHSSSVSCHVIDSEFNLTRFWTQEELLQDQPSHSLDHVDPCIAQFKADHYRDEDGRYVVPLLFKPESPPLGNTRKQALIRLLSTERKNNKNPHQRELYQQSMRDLIAIGHMEKVPPEDMGKPDSSVFYLPHHAVMKESSTSTKLRVVLDGSAKSSTKVSLNEKLMIGPKVQQDLTSILLRFRTHRFVFSADIRKMYNQVKIHPAHTDFLRLLWRESQNEPIIDYRLTILPFGISSAAFIAVYSLYQLAQDEGSKFPLAAEILKRDFYVDNLLGGHDDLSISLKIENDMTALTEKGCFHLCKWSANDSRLLEIIPPEDRETDLKALEIGTAECIKALGVKWDQSNDCFFFTITLPLEPIRKKCDILSYIARIYDPLGWLQPIIITCKILFQQTWVDKTEWRENVSQTVQCTWDIFQTPSN